MVWRRHCIGCVVYADDIPLLPVSCCDLQRFVDIRRNYGILWDIRPKFNTAESQIIYVGLSTRVFLCVFFARTLLIKSNI